MIMTDDKMVFDLVPSLLITEKRIECVRKVLSNIPNLCGFRTALDAGCGVGYFSKFLVDLGYRVSAFDVREENIHEAKRRCSSVDFHIYNAEDPAIKDLGEFDLVLCVGLLYHLENLFLAIRNLSVLTGKILFLETMIDPTDRPTAILMNETGGNDQGVNNVAFIASVPCLIKMLYHAGFTDVYSPTILPDHPDFHETPDHTPRRTVLVASKFAIESPVLKRIEDQYVTRQDIWRKKKHMNNESRHRADMDHGKKVHIAESSALLEERKKISLPWGDHWIISDDVMGRHFGTNRPFELSEQFFLFHYLKPGMNFIDIGAHHGLYSLLASKKVGATGRVISFEPSPREYLRLCEHIQLNSRSNIQTIQSAVSDTEGESDFFVCMGIETGCNSLRLPVVQEEVQKISVPVTTIDLFIAKNPLSRIDFMKIDAEGAELSVLKGAAHAINNFRPLILCEVVDTRTAPWDYKSQDIIDYLDEIGYRWGVTRFPR